MPLQPKSIVFPLGGIHRSFAFPAQPPYTTPDAENVRSAGTITGRTRGGTRPGLVRAFAEQLGSNPITGSIVSVVYDPGTDMSYLHITGTIFSAWMVSAGLTCVSSSNTYPILPMSPPTIHGVVDQSSWQYPPDDFTQIEATQAIFSAGMVGWSIVFGSGTLAGEKLAITHYIDPHTIWVANDVAQPPGTGFTVEAPDNILCVAGDASGESGDFTIPFGQPINCLAAVRPAEGTQASSVVDTFEGRAAGSLISTSPWVASAVPGLSSAAWMSVRQVSGRRYAVAGTWTGSGYAGSNLAAAVTMDLAKPHVFRMLLSPHLGVFAPGSYSLLFRMDDASPNVANSVYVSATPAGGSSWIVTSTWDTAAVTLPGIYPVWLQVTVDGNNIAVYLDGRLLFTATASAPSGSRFGVVLQTNQPLSGPVPLLDEFALYYSAPSLSSDFGRPKLFAVANGVAYREDDAGQLVSIGGSVDVSVVRPMVTAEWGGRLFIADHNLVPRMVQDGCTISNLAGGSPGKVIKHASAVFNNKGIQTANDLCVITQRGSGGAPPLGAYRIASVAADSITLVDVPDSQDSGISIRVERGPKLFNPVTGSLALLQQSIVNGLPLGVMPTGCPLIATFMDRLVLAGNPPHLFYFSRAGDPFDWEFGADPDDPGRATGGATGITGMIGKPLTAIARFSDDYLILGTATELWALHGDPVAGGQMLDLSDKAGIVGNQAWTRMPDGSLIYLSHNGLYRLAPGGNSRPVLMSDRLPQELRDIDTSSSWPILAYGPRSDGVMVYITPRSADRLGEGLGRHWFVDIKHDAFWRERYYHAHEPLTTCLYPLRGVPGESLLLACRDGFVRRYAESTAADHGAPIQAKVLLGPFKAGAADSVFDQLEAVLGESSGPVAWELYSAPTPEAAYERYLAGQPSRTGGTWSAGRNRRNIPRVRGAAHYLLLRTPAGSTVRWEMDELFGFFEAQDVYRPL